MSHLNSKAKGEATWTVACRLRRFSYAQLAAEAHISIERATALVRGWMLAKLVREDGVGDRHRKMFALTERADPGVLPANLTERSKSSSSEEAMWRTIRMQRTFSPRDVACMSTTPDVLVTEEDAQRYLHVLLRGGYLRVVQPAKVTRVRDTIVRKPGIYRLVRNSGPVPPTERRVTGVWDGNTSTFAHLPGSGGDA